jgi:3D (Asp-Asp-Asp) domain-containing protein
MKSIVGGSAAIVATLLFSFLVLSAKPSLAETLLSQIQQQKREVTKAQELAAPSQKENEIAKTESKVLSGVVTEATDLAGAPGGRADATPVAAPVTYLATAYSLSGRTASGKRPSRGLIAADPSVLPLGSRVRLEAGSFSGDYFVGDTGGTVRGKKIDIWTPNHRDAHRFGRRLVKLTVLSYGPKRSPRHRKR